MIEDKFFCPASYCTVDLSCEFDLPLSIQTSIVAMLSLYSTFPVRSNRGIVKQTLSTNPIKVDQRLLFVMSFI